MSRRRRGKLSEQPRPRSPRLLQVQAELEHMGETFRVIREERLYEAARDERGKLVRERWPLSLRQVEVLIAAAERKDRAA
jgi:hypothetical protein